jgi:hypothetical protein
MGEVDDDKYMGAISDSAPLAPRTSFPNSANVEGVVTTSLFIYFLADNSDFE